MKRVVLAFDSLKDCLRSTEASQALACGIRQQCPDADITIVPMADGGEGTLAAVMQCADATMCQIPLRRPMTGAPVTGQYAMLTGRPVAVIEMAQVCGISLLAPPHTPMALNTEALGELIAEAAAQLRSQWPDQPRRTIVVGLGGSATVDCGIGMLAALGAVMRDADGAQLAPLPVNLGKVAVVDTSAMVQTLSGVDIIAACDVSNPLCGTEGAVRVYGEQKGVRPMDILQLDGAMTRFATAMAAVSGRDATYEPHCGAAGGVAAALWALCSARLQSGAAALLQLLDFASIIRDADLVVTGEGQIDAQTAYGKAPLAVVRAAAAAGVPSVAVGGRVLTPIALQRAGCSQVLQLSDLNQILTRAALQPDVARENLRRTGAAIAQIYLNK